MNPFQGENLQRIAVVLILISITACGRTTLEEPLSTLPEHSVGMQAEATPTNTKVSHSVYAHTRPTWFLPDHLSNIAIILVDFQTLQFEVAYFTSQVPCGRNRPPVSDEELKFRAGGIFNAAGTYWTRRVIEEANGKREELAFEVSRIGDFVVLEIPPGDFGGVAVSHPCSGLILYAGSIVWSGSGEQLYPAVAIDPGALEHTSRQVSTPQRIDVRIGPGVHLGAGEAKESGMAAWNSVKGLNLVQELASRPYSVLVYLYPRTVGMFDPARADWVIFVHRGASPEAPTVDAPPTPTPQPPELLPTPTSQFPISPLPTPQP